LGALAFGLLLVWRGQRKSWTRWATFISKAITTIGAVLVAAVLITSIFGIGRSNPVFIYNLLDLKRTTWSGPALSAGKHTVVFDFKADSNALGTGGTGVLSVDGKEVARNTVKNTIPVTFPEDESFDVGIDTRSGVSMLKYRYESPFKFTGTLDKLTFNIKPDAEPAPVKKD
jgi:arylsulfatase